MPHRPHTPVEAAAHPSFSEPRDDHGDLEPEYRADELKTEFYDLEFPLGEGKERIYLVEPTGEIEDDPNLTDKKFPGNPTMSYRSEQPIRVVGEIATWQGHPKSKSKLD